MSLRFLLRAAMIQALAVAGLFALLLAAPLPDDFFSEHGAVAGPAAWVIASLVTGRVLWLALGGALVAALVSGAGAAVAGTLLGHTIGLVVGVAAFGLVAALYGGGRPAAASTARAG